MTKHSPFRYFKSSPEIIRLAVMLYVRFPFSLRNVEDLLHERGVGAGITRFATVAKYNVKWSCISGQFCGIAKMHRVYVHAAFRISVWEKYAASGVLLSRAV
jgi:hypothetical protein